MTFDANKQIAENRRIFQAGVERAEHALSKGDLDGALAWAKISAHFAFLRHPGIYVSPELENLLLEAAAKLETQPIEAEVPVIHGLQSKDYGKMRFLFVLTESYGTGGHTPFISRWIQNTLDNSVHSLITTAHRGELPEILMSAITVSGGWEYPLTELSPNLAEQAYLLRAIARDWADVVVLFIHPYDPLPTVAFGVADCPPVMLCNHADHAFWLGCSIADVIVDYHPQGGITSARRRGKEGSKLLPIPLSNPAPCLRNQEKRRRLGVADDEVMLLTVGREEKFLPFDDISFLDVMVEMLKRHPNAKLFAAGPQPQGPWQRASAAVGGRIQALGTVDRAVLDECYGAADLFVASFPCGSGTAMLEAGLYGLPILGYDYVLLPHISGADDVAFVDTPVHFQSLSAFQAALNSALTDLEPNKKKAQLVQQNIMQKHCPPGWNSYLTDALQALPSQHSIQKPPVTLSETEYADVYLSYLDAAMVSNELPELSFSRLIRVYSAYLSKAEARNAQAKSLMRAFCQLEGPRQSKQYFMGCMDFLTFTLK